jgi:hypothetical protein
MHEANDGSDLSGEATCHISTRYVASVQRAADKAPDKVPLLYYLDGEIDREEAGACTVY